VSEPSSIEMRVVVGPWIEVPPLNGWKGGPDREMRVTVSEGEELLTTACRLPAETLKRMAPDYEDCMRSRTIREAIEHFMAERKVWAAADKLGREMAAGQFDHRPSFLMPEDDYA
jgi:predicted transcriptional regulator